MKIKVAAVQMDIETGAKKANLERTEALMEKAADNRAEALCLPELFTTGYALDTMGSLAEEIPGPTTSFLQGMVEDLGVSLWGGSITEVREDRYYNTSLAMDQRGNIVDKYRKVHLFAPMGEGGVFSRGNEVVTASVDGAVIGMMLCYDIRFPELARRLTMEGAQVLVVPAEFPEPRMGHWRHLLMARAIENQVFVMGVNRVGSDDSSKYFGHSMVVDPWGEVLAEAGGEEDVIMADLDLEEITRVRKEIPALGDRRDEVY